MTNPENNHKDLRSGLDRTVRVLTARGRSAVASILVEGLEVAAAVDRHFQRANGKSVKAVALRKICFGHWISNLPAQDCDSERIGEGVVVVRVAEQPRERIEIHCHGGIAAVERIVSDLLAFGCNVSDSINATNNASCLDTSIQAEAREALLHATTAKTSLALLDQLNGALHKEIEAIIQRIADSPTQDSTLTTTVYNDLSPITQRLEGLQSTWQIGQHLTQPWKVVLGGPPNVGKSSLINAMLGFERSIVFDQPGTTRDVLSSRTAIDGWPVDLSDTAGLRDIDCEIEREGVARGRAELNTADCVVIVYDISQPIFAIPATVERHFKSLLAEGFTNPVLVANKIDLADANVVNQILATGKKLNIPIVATSATTGQGIEQLLSVIARRLIPLELVDGSPIVFSRRQFDLIQNTIEQLRASDVNSALQLLTSLAKP